MVEQEGRIGQLNRERDSLQFKMASAQAVLEGIERVDFSGKRLLRLNQDVEDERGAYEFLANYNRVLAIKQRLAEKAISNFGEKLEENAQAMLKQQEAPSEDGGQLLVSPVPYTFDNESGVLQVGDKSRELKGRERLAVEYLHEHRGHAVLGSSVLELLKEKGFKSSAGETFLGIERRFGERFIIRRERVGRTSQWALGIMPGELEAEEKQDLQRVVIDEIRKTVKLNGDKEVGFEEPDMWDLVQKLSEKGPEGLSEIEIERILQESVSDAIDKLRARLEKDPTDPKIIVGFLKEQGLKYFFNADMKFIRGRHDYETPEPVLKSRLDAIRYFIETENPFVDRLQEILGPTRTNRQLHTQQIRHALVRAAGRILARITDSVATTDEVSLWNLIRQQLKENSNRYVLRRLEVKIRDWQKTEKSESASKKVRPARTARKAVRRQPGEGLKNPLPESRTRAVNTYLDNPNVDFGDIRDILNADRADRQQLTKWNAVRSIVITVSLLKMKVEKGLANPSEQTLWERVKEFSGGEENTLVRVFNDRIKAEYNRQKSESV